jgi:uncharacterized membrane protein YdbT with pleckstrin-like domain
MAARARRMRGLRRHFLVMLVVMAILIPVNFILGPAKPWWIAILLAWGAPLAVHVAWAMELFSSGDQR